MTHDNSMRAVTCLKHGPPSVLHLEKVDKPIPNENEILIKNYASSINTVDIFDRGGAPKFFGKGIKFLVRIMMGMGKPKHKIVGCGFCGEIVSVGNEVKNWKVGDEVYGYSEAGGACAEYLSVPAEIIARKPSNISFHEAAAVPGGASPAVIALRDVAQPKQGQKILIIAASGGIGTFGVQIAKNVYGAEVTGVCGPDNLEMVRNIGADHVIDYTKEDYTNGNLKYDIIFDAIGVSAFKKCEKILKETGIFVTANPIARPGNMFKMSNSRFKSFTADESTATMDQLRDWIESGKIKPVIDTIYPLEKTAEAHKHYETGHSKGRVVISIE